MHSAGLSAAASPIAALWELDLKFDTHTQNPPGAPALLDPLVSSLRFPPMLLFYLFSLFPAPSPVAIAPAVPSVPTKCVMAEPGSLSRCPNPSVGQWDHPALGFGVRCPPLPSIPALCRHRRQVGNGAVGAGSVRAARCCCSSAVSSLSVWS